MNKIMKKIIVIVLIFTFTLSIVGCKKKSNIPSLNDIKTQHYTDDEIERILHFVKRDELIKIWGEPTRTIKHENEDVWVLDERKALVVSYTIFGIVDDVDIED